MLCVYRTTDGGRLNALAGIFGCPKPYQSVVHILSERSISTLRHETSHAMEMTEGTVSHGMKIQSHIV